MDRSDLLEELAGASEGGDSTRIISAIKATKYEQRIYFEHSQTDWQRLDAMTDSDIDRRFAPIKN